MTKSIKPIFGRLVNPSATAELDGWTNATDSLTASLASVSMGDQYDERQLDILIDIVKKENGSRENNREVD